MGLWLAHYARPGSAACNAAQYTEILAAINPTLFTAAARETIAATEALRLCFMLGSDGPAQWVAADTAVDSVLFWHDLSGRPDPDKSALRSIVNICNTPFDPKAGSPLFAWHVFRLADQRFIWLQLYHHLIIDATGRNLLLEDMATRYAHHASASEPPPHGTLATAGLIPALQQRGYEQSNTAHLANARAYWMRLLAGRPSIASLTSSKASDGYTARRESRQIGAATQEALERLGRSVSASLPAVLAAGVALYMARMCSQSDLILGCMTSGRLQPVLRNVPALFADRVALRLTTNASDGVSDLIKQASRQMRLAMRHQRFPYETLRNELGLTPSAAELFGTVFNYLPREGAAQFAGAACRTINVSRGPVRDVCITMLELAAGGLMLEFDCNADRYEAAEVAAHADRFQRLLLILAACEPDTKLDRINLLSDDERVRVLIGFNDTAHPVPAATIPQLFESQVARSPAATALVFGGKSLTYVELDARANRLARHLTRLGIGAEQIIAVAMPRSVDMVVCLLAVLKTGACYLPLDFTLPLDRLGFMLADSAASALLATGRSLDALVQGEATSEAPVLPPTIRLDDPEVQRRVAMEPAHALADSERLASLHPGHLAYVLYTSGSTGMPKGVGNTHAGVINLLSWWQDIFRLSPQDRMLQKAPWTFDASVPEFLHPLLHGAVLVVAPPGMHGEPHEMARYIDAAGITVVHFVPSMLSVFLEACRPDDQNHAGDISERWLPNLRHVQAAGEALSGPLQNRCLARLGATLWNLYGPTEAAVAVAAWQCTAGPDDRAPPIGRPMWNTQMYVLDANLAPVPIGVTGELYLGGAQLARGYIGHAAGLTAERFIACPFGPPGARMYRTGDLARWRHDGAVDFLGRADDQVKLGGVRIEPAEIEAALIALPGIAQAAVQGVIIEGVPALVGYIVPAAGATPLSTQRLRASLAKRLPEEMVPRRYVTLAALPLTTNGKLDRRALPPAGLESAVLPAGRAASGATRAPKTGMEARLCTLFAELTGAGPVGPDDDFFDLGGHSLLALQLIVRLRQTEHVRVDLHTILEHATPTALADAIEQTERRAPIHRPIVGHRFELSHVRAAQGSAGPRGTVLCLPQLGGGADYVGHIGRSALRGYDIWSCSFDLQGREDVTSDAWIECAQSLVQWLMGRPAMNPTALLGFSVSGYVGWLITRLLVAAGHAGLPLINLDGGAIPQRYPDLRSRIAPLLPPDAAAPATDMLLLFRERFGAFSAPFRSDQDWRQLNCRVTPIACRTIRHLDFIDQRVLAMHDEQINRFLAGVRDLEPNPQARSIPTQGGALFELLDRDPPPAPSELRQFMTQLPEGAVDPDFELALLYLTLASGDADLALQAARRSAATRPDHRNAYYAQVALLSELGRNAEAEALARAWCAGREDDPVMRKRAVERIHAGLLWDGRFGLYLSGEPMERALDIAAARCAGTL